MKGTRFTKSEEATALMGAVWVVDGWMGGNLRKEFQRFNEDLRGCVRGGLKVKGEGTINVEY